MKRKFLDLNDIAPKLFLIEAALVCPFVIISLARSAADIISIFEEKPATGNALVLATAD